jgi:hypothetical protein
MPTSKQDLWTTPKVALVESLAEHGWFPAIVAA